VSNTIDSHPDPDEDNPKRVAAQLISGAWREAVAKGVANELIASTALSAAVASLVKTHDLEAAARMLERLAEAIRSGKFDYEAKSDE
jgi:hypothetical protein